MLKTPGISYKVFLFERVKKKTLFLNAETYPLQIRLTAGTKTIYIKSHFFSLLQLKKYQQEMQENSAAFILNQIIRLEEDLLAYMLRSQPSPAPLDRIRNGYNILSKDILHQMDEDFKDFLVDFFYAERLPVYALFINNDGANHRSEFILNTLEKSLQPAMYQKLLAMAAEKAPPYIPFIRFWQENRLLSIPLFPVFYWKRENAQHAFSQFLQVAFPEYDLPATLRYIENIGEELLNHT